MSGAASYRLKASVLSAEGQNVQVCCDVDFSTVVAVIVDIHREWAVVMLLRQPMAWSQHVVRQDTDAGIFIWLYFPLPTAWG